MRNESSGSPIPEPEYGWGPNNELLHEFWPMEIPPPADEHENDPLELPLRVPQSGLLSRFQSQEKE